MSYIIYERDTGLVERITSVVPEEQYANYDVAYTELLLPGDELGHMIYVTVVEEQVTSISTLKMGLSQRELKIRSQMLEDEITNLKSQNISMINTLEEQKMQFELELAESNTQMFEMMMTMQGGIV